MSYLSLIKGFLFTLIGWLGITITHPNGFLYIHVEEGSAAYYGIYIFCAIVLMAGLHNIYKLLHRGLRCFQVKNYRRIKSRINEKSNRT